jgi:hypothetical protein
MLTPIAMSATTKHDMANAGTEYCPRSRICALAASRSFCRRAISASFSPSVRVVASLCAWSSGSSRLAGKCDYAAT